MTASRLANGSDTRLSRRVRLRGMSVNQWVRRDTLTLSQVETVSANFRVIDIFVFPLCGSSLRSWINFASHCRSTISYPQ